ncbi:MAG TPA: Bax inhibitor-1/YccA family protein [Usitatibacter sp.]|jgi:FtsH-binding integral membrane protein|nr:Bax inhibitor-1/YccA family protein [Usitatibacter sp.]
MQPETPLVRQGEAASTYALSRNRVLRNTYALLALSMLPTIAGAWLGVALKLNQVVAGHGGMFALVFLVGAYGLMFAVQANRNSGLGVALLLAFTFFMGVMLAPLLGVILGMSNGVTLIAFAFGGTAVVFTAMASLGTVIKRDLGGLGKFLFVGAIMLLVAMIANIFLQMPGLMIALSLIAIGIFSAFMLYDVNRIVTGGETNYVSATLNLYLDIYNVFTNLLAILGITGGSSD